VNARHVLHRDIETRSTVDLSEVGAWRYASDPNTGVWCATYANDSDPPQIWTPDQPIPEIFSIAARDPDWIVIAHNDAFERAIEELILAPRYGWPIVPIERHRCTMAMALASALPGSLDSAVEVLNSPFRKDVEGQRLMRKMARPRKARAGEDPNGLYWHDEPENQTRLQRYCMCDTEAERWLYQRVPPLTDPEQAFWALDAVVNQRGFHTDGALLEAASCIAAAAGEAVQEELARITAGALTSTDQVAAMLAWLAEHGCEVKNLQKPTLKHALRRKELDPVARRVIELRLGAAHAAAAKVDTLLAWREADGRVRGTLRFHGAGTGRWTGHGPQPQNFKRDSDGIDAKLAAVATGDLDHVAKLYPQPLEIVGDIARGMICAAPKHRLLIGDFSGIESRVLAWVSGQQSKLEQWAKFDRTGDPKDEPYYILGRNCGRPEESARKIGKTADLAFGYMGGPGAWDRLAPDDDSSTEDDKRRYQKTWRSLHPQTVQFWASINRAAINAVRKPGTTFSCRRLTVVYDGEMFLRITLPSGRSLSYPAPRLATDKFGNAMVVFKDNAAGKWVDCRHGHGAYGGLWTENIVQAISRDLLAGAMQRLEAAGYSIVLHVHDEIVCEAPIEFGSTEEFQRLITTLPDWAAGLPIAAKVRNGERFSKSEKPAPATPDYHDEINTGLKREGIEPINWDAFAKMSAESAGCSGTGESKITNAQPSDAVESQANHHATVENSDNQSDFENSSNTGGNSAGNGKWGDYHGGESERGADKPYGPVRAALYARGYRVARAFPFTVPGEVEPRFYEDRFELRPEIKPTKERPHKTSRFWRRADGKEYCDTGPRRIVYNWPAIMAAGPGATVLITEGANKSEPLNKAGLLATAAPYHQWGPECIAALVSRHLIYFEDHDLADEDGRIKAKEFSTNAHRNLGPIAASFRIVPALHLWKNLKRNGEPPHAGM
jgi:DNA polymerase